MKIIFSSGYNMKFLIYSFLALLATLLIIIFFPVDYPIIDEKLQFVDDSDVNVKKNKVGVYLINLADSKERLATILPKLTGLSLPITLVEAIDGRKLPKDELDRLVGNSYFLNKFIQIGF